MHYMNGNDECGIIRNAYMRTEEHYKNEIAGNADMDIGEFFGIKRDLSPNDGRIIEFTRRYPLFEGGV